MRRKTLGIILIMLACLVLFPINGKATTITLDTPPGASTGGGAVSSEVTFLTSAGTIDITLTNTLSNVLVKDVAQNLSDLGFALSTGQTTGTLSSSSGLERTVGSSPGKLITDGSIVATGWALESITSPFAGLRLHLLGTPEAPAHTIIGEGTNGGTYPNANASIAGNGPHNPFLAGPVSFELSVPGVTDQTTITNVFFSYGTTEGINVFVPEPGILILLGIAMTAVGVASRYVRKI